MCGGGYACHSLCMEVGEQLESLFFPSRDGTQVLRSTVLEGSILAHGGILNMSGFCFSSFVKIFSI